MGFYSLSLGKSICVTDFSLFFAVLHWLVWAPSRRLINEARKTFNFSSDEVAATFVRKHGHRIGMRPVAKWRKLLHGSLLEFDHWFGRDHFRAQDGRLLMLEKASFNEGRAFALFLELTGGVREGLDLSDVHPHVVGDALFQCDFGLGLTLQHLRRYGWEDDCRGLAGRGRRHKRLTYCPLCGWTFASPGRAASGFYFCDDSSCIANFLFCVECRERMERTCWARRRRCPGCKKKLTWLPS